MKRAGCWVLSLIVVMFFAGAAVIVQDADARAGGGRSSGSSGSRSSAAPSRSTSGASTGTPNQQPLQSPALPAGGGFFRSMGGGILGGLLGGMLFSSLGFGGAGGGFGGSGIGIFEIIMFGGIAYLIYSMVIRKRSDAVVAYQEQQSQQGTYQYQGGYPALADNGLEQLRRMDPTIDENSFKETVLDIFFKVQGCWTNRNLSAGNNLLTDEMKGIFQEDIGKLLKDRKSNRLENIAVRKVEIVEAWQELGLDYVKALFTANLLDYTIDDTTGDVVAGSKTDPVKFEEYWTFTKTTGSNSWKLTAISQV
jgi:predicted lipid-binding transport protein (Tim44 family)